jgi:hypothetical protein
LSILYMEAKSLGLAGFGLENEIGSSYVK